MSGIYHPSRSSREAMAVTAPVGRVLSEGFPPGWFVGLRCQGIWDRGPGDAVVGSGYLLESPCSILQVVLSLIQLRLDSFVPDIWLSKKNFKYVNFFFFLMLFARCFYLGPRAAPSMG